MFTLFLMLFHVVESERLPATYLNLSWKGDRLDLNFFKDRNWNRPSHYKIGSRIKSQLYIKKGANPIWDTLGVRSIMGAGLPCCSRQDPCCWGSISQGEWSLVGVMNLASFIFLVRPSFCYGWICCYAQACNRKFHWNKT